MARDVVYIFDKLTYAGSVLGEIQTDFNMGLTIDGTKDSCSVLVYSYSGVEIEPYSPIYHPKTNTWWCVSSDKVERYAHDSGYLYIHNLELLGAIEILNARDLTDCGFRDKRYTFYEFIQRLFSLSNYNLENSSLLLDCDFYNVNTTIEFIKTFENYTLLSALREFLDAFNMTGKLSFQLQNMSITNTVLTIIPKTGSSSLGVHSIDDFDDIREIKTMHKNSFGVSVISNAENVISSVPKTFPTLGAVKPVSKEYKLTAENAIIKLPSKVYKLNWLKLVNTRANIVVTIGFQTSQGAQTIELTQSQLNLNAYDDQSIRNAFNEIKFYVQERQTAEFYNQFVSQLDANMPQIINDLKKASTITLYDDFEIEPVDASHQNIIKRSTMPYIAKAYYWSKGDLDLSYERYLLCTDKTNREHLLTPWTAIYWERGSDEIAGFDGFEPVTGRGASIYILNFKYTDLQEDIEIATAQGDPSVTDKYVYFNYMQDNYNFVEISTDAGHSYPFRFLGSTETQYGGGHITNFIVNYIPMSDIKIKVDNTRNKRDIQLYNQNGKITDGIALSKLLNSYSKEISSDNITRYAQYHNFSDVPKVGSIVTYNGIDYVINNVSLTFTQREHNTSNDNSSSGTMVTDQYFGYYIEAEISMSQYCSTKSLMVNPNDNIRDYGIPQNYNVKRKQVYRDFFELNYSYNSDTEDDYYIEPRKIFYFSHTPNTMQDFVGVIKLTYEEEVEGQYSWYYQLETTRYIFDKMFYVVLDFKDNNIIGYSNQNVYSGFVISRVFSGQIDTINTPISYVDDDGSFKDVDILFMNNEQLTKDYDNYITNHPDSHRDSWLEKGNTLYNYSVFIPAEIFTSVVSDMTKYDLRIIEHNYNKDALEVPVFEYGCQIDDTTEVIVGDNIFKQYNDPNIVYFYSYVKGHNLGADVQPENHVHIINLPILFRRFSVTNGVKFNYMWGQVGSEDYGLLQIWTAFYEEECWYWETKSWDYLTQQNVDANYDYAIFRHAFNLETQEEVVDLLFVAKNVPSSAIMYGNRIVLKLNHYKLN